MDSGFVLLRHSGFPPFQVLMMIVYSLFQCLNWVGRRELNHHCPQSQCGALPIELRPTQKGDKESSVTRHFADVVTFSIRPKLAGMTRLELANQLIENQSALHFAFIPVIVWCAWRDSNSSQSWS